MSKEPPTVSKAPANKTENSDTTYSVSNREFLETVFRAPEPSQTPFVVSFMGNPGNAPNGAWRGHTWIGDAQADGSLDGGANNYFSLAGFKAGNDGQFRRKKSQFVSLPCLMLDDIGTKVPIDRIGLEPSWQLETSHGNFQYGYLLKEPILHGRVADRLMNAVIAAGLCDPGSSGPCTRLARLPAGSNGKHEPPFVCRLTGWDPILRYAIEELVDGLELDFSIGSSRPSSSERNRTSVINEVEPVHIESSATNIVLTNLMSKGLYKKDLGDAKHDITCPWVEEHTNNVDGGTAYFEPSETRPIGGFKCLHGHCAGRRIRELLDRLSVDVDSARIRSTIRVVPGRINEVIEAAEKELAKSTRYFQRGGAIVTVSTDLVTKTAHLREVNQYELVSILAAIANWERMDMRSNSYRAIDPPPRHVLMLLEAQVFRHLPLLTGLARQPYLRPDGSLVTKPGYDELTTTFSSFDESDSSTPLEPTREQALDALELLKELLTEFSFESKADLAAAISTILTATIRPSLQQAPMTHVTAPVAGSGKSYLCKVLSAFAAPGLPGASAFPSSEEECGKLLLSELLGAPAVIEFDNLTDNLVPYKSLCSALTSETISGRILGQSKVSSVGTRVLFLSSGNNVGPVKDMVRRCLTISLLPDCENPALRSFSNADLLGRLQQTRGQYVSAALTIIRAWIVAGRPKSGIRELAGFREWSDHCRQPLAWLGMDDPATSVFKAASDDPDRERLNRLLSLWRNIFGDRPTMVRDLVAYTNGGHELSTDLNEVLSEIAEGRGELNRGRLGAWLRRSERRIVNGSRLLRATSTRSAAAWRVMSVW